MTRRDALPVIASWPVGTEKLVAQAGDFLYIPGGVPHHPANASATEPAVAVLTRTDANQRESAISLAALDALPHLRRGAIG